MTGIDEVWAIIKLRYGIADNTNKPIVDTYIQQVGTLIMDYCNISTVPVQLYFLWAEMVVKLLLVDMPYLLPEVSEQTDTSGGTIKVGDTSIGDGGMSKNSVYGSLTLESMSFLLMNYKAQLNHYRRLRWC